MRSSCAAIRWLYAAALLFPSLISAWQEPTYTIRVTSDLNQISIVPRDHAGHFVRNLARYDFDLKEDGQSQQVLAIDLETLDSSLHAESTRRALPLLTSSNPISPEAAKGLRLLVLLFDFTSLDLPGAARSLRAAEAYIERIGPADRLSIVSLAPNMRVEQDFTGDRTELLRVLRTMHGLNSTALKRTSDASDDVFRLYWRFQSLRMLATALSRVPQKKSVIVFGEGAEPGRDSAGMNAVIDAAVHGGVTFYGVDGSGLSATPPLGDASTAGGLSAAVLSGEAVLSSTDAATHEQDWLYSVARGTGGRAFFNSNDLARAFRTVEADTQQYYLLSYHSSNTARDGRFRRISVRVRRRGVEVKHPAGYYATREIVATGVRDTERLIADELSAELPSTNLPVYGFVKQLPVKPDLYFLPIMVVVPAEAFLAHGSPSDASIGLVVRDSEGRVIRTLRDRISATAVEGHARTAIQYDTATELSSGDYTLRLVIVQNDTAQAGTFTTTIHLDSTDPSRLSVSSMLTGSSVSENSGRPDSPLDVNGSRLIINPFSAFPASEGFSLHYQVDCPNISNRGSDTCDPKQTRSSLQCFLADQRSVQMVPPAAITRGSAAVFRVDLPAGTFNPGMYTCRVTAINTRAKAFAFGSMKLRILEPLAKDRVAVRLTPPSVPSSVQHGSRPK